MHKFVSDQGLCELLLENVPAAIAVFDTDMRYVACSRQWLSNRGIEDRDVIGQSHYELFPGIDERWRAIHRRALSGESVSNDAEPIRRANGTLEWVEWEAKPWRDNDGSIKGLLLVEQVLTDTVENKRRIRSLRSKLDLLIDSASHHAICMLDPEGRVVIWNAGAERLYGWSESEVIGQPYDMMFDTADREAGLPGLQIEEARRRGTFSRRAWRLRKDGTRFLADGIVNRITDDSGNIMGFGQVVRDITEETEHARALATNEAQLRAILETVPDAMITIDEMGMILSFSATAESLFGYSSQEVIGCNVSMLMPDADAARHNGYLARYMSTGERHVIGNSRRVLGRRKDGTIFPHELYVGEADGGDHRIFTGFLRDLTTREEAEAKLRELQTELIVMSRISAVGTMATALAHELNQPLTAITNYTQSAAALMPAAEQAPLDLVREALEETGREAMRAGAIVRRLRDFVASGELDRISFSPRELAMQTADLALVGEATRNIHCTISIPPNLSPVLVDRVQVQQVLLNLIRNAIEALKENGTIAISANQESSMMRFSIVDSGPGVAPGKEEDVFEPFVSSKASGMGMGLPICRTIIEAHGGKLWCEAQPGQGGMFHFTVPVAEIDDD